MRVALVTSGYPPHVGGVERHTQRLAQSLAGLGCEVEVLTQGHTATRRRLTRNETGSSCVGGR